MLFSRPRRSFFLPSAFVLGMFLSAPLVYSQGNSAFPEKEASHPQRIPALSQDSTITVPGPVRSLERMAGISQKVNDDEVLPLLARNIYVQGYVGWQDQGRPTEFLVLLGRYVNQAQELAALAGDGNVVHVVNCQEAEA